MSVLALLLMSSAPQHAVGFQAGPAIISHIGGPNHFGGRAQLSLTFGFSDALALRFTGALEGDRYEEALTTSGVVGVNAATALIWRSSLDDIEAQTGAGVVVGGYRYATTLRIDGVLRDPYSMSPVGGIVALSSVTLWFTETLGAVAELNVQALTTRWDHFVTTTALVGLTARF